MIVSRIARLSVLLTVLPVVAPQAPSAPDVERALVDVRVRAARGDLVAQYTLGAILYSADENLAEAVRWVRAAAEQGHADAEFHVGQLYDYGFGVERDERAAMAWYRRAAEHGSAAASRVVGDFYRRGRAVTADAVEAVRWYRRGAEGDDLRAQYQLGQLYFDGEGVTRDYATAYVWLTLAAGQTPLDDNRKGILEIRNIAAARMTSEAVSEADGRVGAWRPARP